MPPVLTLDDVDNLLSSVESSIRDSGCDHSLRFTKQWATEREINWGDLVDILEANGAFCDCEVVLNITEDSILDLPQDVTYDTKDNPWLIPQDFIPKTDIFTKQLVCRHSISNNTHSDDGEILVPPPQTSKPRKRMRKSVHYFVGLQSGLPSELGLVVETEPFNAEEFVNLVRSSNHPEFTKYTEREAAFFLSKLANLKPDTPVGSHFMDKLSLQGQKTHELRIHKVFIRK